MTSHTPDMSNLLFRQIMPDDFDTLARFLTENDVPSVVRTFNPFPMTEETARKIAREPRKDRYYGAFSGAELVGLSMLRGWDEGYSIPSFGIMVDYRFHGVGIGGRMLDYTIEEARRLGCAHVRLTVYAGNAAGVHLYTSRGFVEDSRAPVMVSGESDTKIVMLKELV